MVSGNTPAPSKIYRSTLSNIQMLPEVWARGNTSRPAAIEMSTAGIWVGIMRVEFSNEVTRRGSPCGLPARRWLAMLESARGQGDFANDRVVIGIHFGKQIEMEFEDVSDSASTEDQLQAQPKTAQTPRPDTAGLASRFVSNGDTALHKVIRFSRKQYDQWTAQEQARERRSSHGNRNRPGRKENTLYRRRIPSH